MKGFKFFLKFKMLNANLKINMFNEKLRMLNVKNKTKIQTKLKLKLLKE